MIKLKKMKKPSHSTSLLEIKNLTVTFDGFKAINDLTLTIMPNTIQVIIGPNGAGKSTLMDTIIGRITPTSGRVIFKGNDITRLPEYEIMRRGICRKFQTPGVLPALSVEDNILLAGKMNRHWWYTLNKSITQSEKHRASEVIAMVKLTHKQYQLAGLLAHGEKQWLETGMVINSNADLLLFDEPAAGLTQSERESMSELMRGLVQNHTLIVIDHDMDFIEQLKAPITVLHNGKLLKQGSIAEIRQDPEVRSIYLGREGDFHAHSEKS